MLSNAMSQGRHILPMPLLERCEACSNQLEPMKVARSMVPFAKNLAFRPESDFHPPPPSVTSWNFAGVGQFVVLLFLTSSPSSW